MKISDFTILFIAIAICLGIVSFGSIDITRRANTRNVQYADKLSSACLDAASTMKTQNIEKFGCVWNDENDLNETLDVFYNSLVYSFYYESAGRAQDMALYTPVVCLIDVDGYYISHNIVFDKTGMVTSDADHTNPLNLSSMDKRNGLTTLNTWTENLGSVILRYYLSNYVEVYTSDGKTYSGDRMDVYKEILEKDPAKASELLFITDNEEFSNRKNTLIVREINKQCEYYINRHNVIGDSYEKQYTFEMPEVAGEDWSRLVESPTVISFLQGYSSKADNRLLNIYALAGGELVENYHYFIVTDPADPSNKEYHCVESDPDVSEETKTETISYESAGETKTNTTTYVVYKYRGEEIDTIYNTQTECAKRGATPHRCVYEWSY